MTMPAQMGPSAFKYMSSFLELDRPWTGECLFQNAHPEFVVEPANLYQHSPMSHADSLRSLYEQQLQWDFESVELLTGISKPPQLPGSVDDEYEGFDTPHFFV